LESRLFLSSAVIAALVIVLPLLFHMTKYLGAKSDNIRKNEPYEGGVRKTIKDPFDRFNVKFYLVAIVFLIFDVEVLFLFPWAVNLRELGIFGIFEMFLFIFILIIGLFYVFKLGVLRWI